jgi:GntR family transcriptional regulator
MIIEIDSHSGVPIYRQIIDQIRSHIITARLTEGAQLPSVRDLAGRLKVNPMTISKVYSYLENEGVVERKRGIGLFVAKISKNKQDKAKTAMLEDILTKAAATAVEVGLTEKQATNMFTKLFRQNNLEGSKK